MPVSEAKRRNNDAYNAKCDTIVLRPRKETGQEVRTAASASGQSLQGYILQAVRERMARDAAGAAPGGVAVALPAETAEAARRAAETAGVSVDQWIVEAIREKL